MERENLASLIAAVRTPLGFFALCITSIEGILWLLSTRASGTDFTLLVSGMLLVFLVLIFIVYLLVRIPDHWALYGLSDDDLNILAVLNNKSGMEVDEIRALFGPQSEARIARLVGKRLIRPRGYARRSFIEPTPLLNEIFRLANRLGAFRRR